jgi:hypothetical protein
MIYTRDIFGYNRYNQQDDPLLLLDDHICWKLNIPSTLLGEVKIRTFNKPDISWYINIINQQKWLLY